MTTLDEGNLRLTFPDGWLVTQYDRWRFFARFSSTCGGNKAVDVLALDPASHGLWMIELKDYRQKKRTKDISLWTEIAIKVRDTLAGLATATFNADDEERALAEKCLGATRLSVVLHLERPAHLSKLFTAFPDRADLVMKLKQLLKTIDPHPRVVDMEAPLGGSPWLVESIGGGES